MNSNDLMKYKSDIEQAIRNKLYCKFVRAHINDEALYGYPLAIIDGWCIVARFWDFFQDGFFIIRIKDITDLLIHQEDEFYSQMLLKEGFGDYSDYQNPLLVSTSIYEVLSLFRNMDENIVIECEKRDGFYIGKIKKVTKTYLLFHFFNVEGTWREMLNTVRLTSITKIEFKTSYLRVFSKYLPPEDNVQ